MITAAEQRLHRRELARHEASHCAAFVAAGVMPKQVHVTVDDRQANGAVTIRQADLTGVKGLVAVLAGVLALGEPAPSWPPIKGRSTDEDQIRDLVDQLGAKREGYEAAVRATGRVIAGEVHMKLEDAFAYALENFAQVIDRAGIERIVDIVARHYDEED